MSMKMTFIKKINIFLYKLFNFNLPVTGLPNQDGSIYGRGSLDAKLDNAKYEEENHNMRGSSNAALI